MDYGGGHFAACWRARESSELVPIQAQKQQEAKIAQTADAVAHVAETPQGPEA